MKKRILAIIIFVMVFLSSCGTTVKKISYKYSVDTGDSIMVSMDTTDGYSLTAENPFQITKDGEAMSQGMFVPIEYYDTYFVSVSGDADAMIIDYGETDNFEYFIRSASID